jgi:hypothetical protein
LLQKYVGQRKVGRPLKGVKKGEWYISKYLLPRGENQYKPKLLMG